MKTLKGIVDNWQTTLVGVIVLTALVLWWVTFITVEQFIGVLGAAVSLNSALSKDANNVAR